MFQGKKGNVLFKAIALMMSVFIMLGMSGIKTLANEEDDKGSSQVTDSSQGSVEGQGISENSYDSLPDQSNQSIAEKSSNSDESETSAATADSSSGKEGNTAGTADSSATAKIDESSSSDSASSQSSTSPDSLTSNDTKRVLGARRNIIPDSTSPVISNSQIVFANGALEDEDYRWEEGNCLRTRNAVTISVNVEDPDPNTDISDEKDEGTQNSSEESATPFGENPTNPNSNVREDVSGISKVIIEYKDILSGETIQGNMNGYSGGIYLYTFPEEVAAYQVKSITAIDGNNNEAIYSSSDLGNDQNDHNIFASISIEEDQFNGGSGKSNYTNCIRDYSRVLTAGNNQTSGFEDDPWISLKGEDDARVSLSLKFCAFLTRSKNVTVSLVPVDEFGNQIGTNEDKIEGKISYQGYFPITWVSVEFELPNDKDQYTIYKVESSGNRFFNNVIKGINYRGFIYVKLDSTSPVAKDIEVSYDSDGDNGVSGQYNFGKGDERIIYSKNSLTLSVNTSNCYDPAISYGGTDDSIDDILASGICKLTYVEYNDQYPTNGSGIYNEVEISDKEIDECGNIRIELPNVSNGQGPIYIGDVRLVDNAGNETRVYGGRIEPVSYVIDNVSPVIEFTHLDGESLSGNNYAKDLATTSYFYNHDIKGQFDVEERYISEVVLSKNSDYMVPVLSVPDNISNELGAVNTYTFSTAGDGDYFFSVNAKDMSGNDAEPVCSPYFVVDTIAPVITVTYTKAGSQVTPDGKDVSYYNDNITVNFKVEDKHLLMEGIDAVITGSYADGKDVNIPVTSWSYDESSFTWTASVELSADGEYAVSAIATDRAENVSDKYTGEGFTIDSTTPVVTISFDNNSFENEIYYNASRTATITVKDYTFDAGKDELNINAPDNAPTISNWTSDGNQTYTKTVAFILDGQYDFTFMTTDKAGNESQIQTISLFIIDTTAPVITVTYDNNEGRNTYYYDFSRTATIRIDEKSFSSDSVVIDSQKSNDDVLMSALPGVSGFSENASKDSYTASMSFTADGKYGYTISATDLAGNKSELYTSDIFVIDTIAPTITFGGVDNYSANNKIVAPVVTYNDTNIDANKVQITMSGANNGVVAQGFTQSTSIDTVTIAYDDFAYNKETDDLYTLSVSITDMAGNVTEDELVFSVNRFGSVYVVGDSTRALIDKYYTNEPQDVTITEINVDSLTYKEVSIDNDGDSKVLKEGKGYNVAVQGDDKSWKSMTYTIKANNFKKDGNYSVMVYSKDRASNTQDNRSAEKEIEFAVDTTAPSIVTSGIEEEGIYEEEGHNFMLSATDNMGFESLVIYTGQAELSELESYTGQEIESMNGTITVQLPEMDVYQNVMVLATDVAGNRTELDYNNVVVSRNATTIINDLNNKPNAVIKPMVIDPDKEVSPYKKWAMAAGAATTTGGAGAGVYFLRKKKLRLKK